MVIFLLYHGVGHFNACVKMARILDSRYRVYFAGASFFKEHVERLGIRYHELDSLPFGMGFEKWTNEVGRSKFVYLSSLRDRWRNELYFRRRSELVALINTLNPETVLIDSFQGTDLIALYPILKANAVRVALVNTMPSMAVLPGMPPINSVALPGEKQRIRQSKARFWFRKMRKVWWQRLKYVGMDDYRIISRGRKQSNFPSRYLSPHPVSLGIGFRLIPELFLIPRAYEFETMEYAPNQKFIGFMADPDRHLVTSEAMDPLRSRLESNTSPCVYCAFGTVTSKYSRRIQSFIARLLEAVKGRDLFVIISLPAQVNESAFGHVGPATNVYFIKEAPQTGILRYADLFITHGGLNSIKESILAGVPMLVFPLDDNFDQPGNSSRVVYHRMGLRGHLLRETPGEIHHKIFEVLQNQIFKEGVEEMKAKDRLYTSDNFLSVFAQIPAIS